MKAFLKVIIAVFTNICILICLIVCVLCAYIRIVYFFSSVGLVKFVILFLPLFVVHFFLRLLPIGEIKINVNVTSLITLRG